MPGELIIRRVATRNGKQGSLFDLYAWFFMRIFGIILLGMLLFHWAYLHFIIPGGVTGIDYSVIVKRWATPVWRIFDLLLLFFALTHGANGMRQIINTFLQSDSRRVTAKAVLFIIYFMLMVMGNAIIFSVNPH